MPYGWKKNGKFIPYRNPSSNCPGCSGVFSERGGVKKDIPQPVRDMNFATAPLARVEPPMYEPWNMPQAGIWPQNPYVVQYPYITPFQGLPRPVQVFASPQLPHCSAYDAPSPYCAFARPL